MSRPRAADDFDMIYQRIKELRRETAAPPPADASQQRGAAPLIDQDRRMKDRREGLPPPWAPTLFLKRPTVVELARRFWRTRSGG